MPVRGSHIISRCGRENGNYRTFGFREEEANEDEVYEVQADEDEVVPPGDVGDRDVGDLREEDVEGPVSARSDTGADGTRSCWEDLRMLLISMKQDQSALRHTSDARTQLTGPKLREKKILVRKIMAIPALCAGWFVD